MSWSRVPRKLVPWKLHRKDLAFSFDMYRGVGDGWRWTFFLVNAFPDLITSLSHAANSHDARLLPSLTSVMSWHTQTSCVLSHCSAKKHLCIVHPAWPRAMRASRGITLHDEQTQNLSQLQKQRLEKFTQLKKAGVALYPNDFQKDTDIVAIRSSHVLPWPDGS
jgi:hypothetical protein